MIQAEIFGDSWTEIIVPLPALHGEGRIRITVPSGVRCAAPRVMLDAIPLAVEVSQPANGVMEVLAGPVSGGKLIVGARAVPPVEATAQLVTVECDDAAPIHISLSANGVVRFVAGRSGWKVPAVANYGETVEAKIQLRNDGTAPLSGGLCYIALPAGVVPGFQNERREVNADGQRVLVMDVPDLPVRGTEELVTPLFVTDPSLERVKVRAKVVDATGVEIATFDSHPVEIVHKINPMVTVHLRDSGPLRFGDELRCQVLINQGGAPLPDASLTIEGTFAEPIAMDLGPLQHGERRTIPFSVRLKTISSNASWTDMLYARLTSSAFADRTVSYGFEVPCAGHALLQMRAQIAGADETGAHRVDVLIENRGDGVAVAPLLKGKKVPSVRAVVDSLTVDGVADYTVDGSVPVFDDGIRLPDLGLAQRCAVSFAIRSTKALEAILALSVESESACAKAAATGTLTAAAKRKAGSFKRSTSVAESAPALLEPEARLSVAPLEEDTVASVSEEVPPLDFPSDWSELAKQYVDDGRVPLGRHVVALLSWLPTGSRIDQKANESAVTLNAEVEQMQRAGLAPLLAGFWGASGIAIATPAIRAAAEAFAEARDVQYPSGGQLTALRWLAVQTQVPQPLESWRDAVINGLANAQSEEDLENVLTFTMLDVAA